MIRILLLALLLALPAQAQRLTVGLGAGPTSMDPHFAAFSPNFMLGFHLFQPLTVLDARLGLQPGAARSWRAQGTEGFVFELDPAARFSDGTPLTAEDVAASLARAPSVPGGGGGFQTFLAPVAGVEVLDTNRVLVRTRGAAPGLPRDLARIAILPASARAALTPEFNAGRVPGSGPFRLVAFTPGNEVLLARNPHFAGPAPHWAEVRFRTLPNNASRTAALLAGDVDVIDSVPTTDLPRLRGDARLTVVEALSNRIILLSPLQAEAAPLVTARDGAALPRNPLRDGRVREALSLAIDREALVARVLDGAGAATGQFGSAGMFGHDPGIPAPTPDLARARRLLAEAGYPEGFALTLRGPNDRYVNDERVLQAVGAMWQRIAVPTRVEALPWNVFSGRLAAGDFGVALTGLAVGTGDTSLLLRLLIGSRGTPHNFGGLNNTGYANPGFDALLARALGTVDDGAREGLLREATRLAMEDHAILPLHIEKTSWALRRPLAFEGRADQYTMAQEVFPR